MNTEKIPFFQKHKHANYGVSIVAGVVASIPLILSAYANGKGTPILNCFTDDEEEALNITSAFFVGICNIALNFHDTSEGLINFSKPKNGVYVIALIGAVVKVAIGYKEMKSPSYIPLGIASTLVYVFINLRGAQNLYPKLEYAGEFLVRYCRKQSHSKESGTDTGESVALLTAESATASDIANPPVKKWLTLEQGISCGLGFITFFGIIGYVGMTGAAFFAWGGEKKPHPLKSLGVSTPFAIIFFATIQQGCVSSATYMLKLIAEWKRISNSERGCRVVQYTLFACCALLSSSPTIAANNDFSFPATRLAQNVFSMITVTFFNSVGLIDLTTRKEARLADTAITDRSTQDSTGKLPQIV